MERLEELLKELRDIALKRLVERDWYDIDDTDINNEIDQILLDTRYGQDH